MQPQSPPGKPFWAGPLKKIINLSRRPSAVLLCRIQSGRPDRGVRLPGPFIEKTFSRIITNFKLSRHFQKIALAGIVYAKQGSDFSLFRGCTGERMETISNVVMTDGLRLSPETRSDLFLGGNSVTCLTHWRVDRRGNLPTWAITMERMFSQARAGGRKTTSRGPGRLAKEKKVIIRIDEEVSQALKGATHPRPQLPRIARDQTISTAIQTSTGSFPANRPRDIKGWIL